MSSTYASLQADIADWLNRQDLTARVPSFIRLAEARFNRDLRVRQMIKRAVAVADGAENYFTLPTDWLQARQIRAAMNGRLVALEYLTLEGGDDYTQARAGAGGVPRYFNLTGNRLEIIPRPPENTEVEMVYYGRIPALSDETPSNWLLETWPDMYLYGTLAHTAPYLKDDDRIATWAALYDRGLEEIRLADDRAHHASFSLRMRAKPIG
jgi:hypothetical protein